MEGGGEDGQESVTAASGGVIDRRVERLTSLIKVAHLKWTELGMSWMSRKLCMLFALI